MFLFDVFLGNMCGARAGFNMRKPQIPCASMHQRRESMVFVPDTFYVGVMLPPRDPDQTLKARGADTRPEGRFETHRRVREADGWDIPEDSTLLRTEVVSETPRSIITRNTSPSDSFAGEVSE